MSIDPALVVAGLIVGFVVGMTGMGGGALMTPILVLVLGITPSSAVSSDLVASLIMKPVGATVHARRGTVNKELVGWLCLGSVPTAFFGVLVLQSLGGGKELEDNIKLFLGVALLLAAVTMIVKNVLVRRRTGALAIDPALRAPLHIRPVLTLMIGAIGGLVVGMTSVGSGSLIIVMLMLLYPTLTARELVGTDLVQAIPLVASAALGHMIFGSVDLTITGSLLIGALPAVYVGARMSAKAPDAVIRPILVLVLLISSLKLLQVSNEWLMVVLGVGLAGYLVMMMVSRRRATTATAGVDVALEPSAR